MTQHPKSPEQLGLPLLPPPQSEHVYLIEHHGDRPKSTLGPRMLEPAIFNSTANFETYFEYLQETDGSIQEYSRSIKAVGHWKTYHADIDRSRFEIFSKWSKGINYIHERSIHVVFEKNTISRMTIALFTIFLSSAFLSLIFSATNMASGTDDLSLSIYIALSTSILSGIACSDRAQRELNRKST